jgi:hypothetical protein
VASPNMVWKSVGIFGVFAGFWRINGEIVEKKKGEKEKF